MGLTGKCIRKKFPERSICTQLSAQTMGLSQGIENYRPNSNGESETKFRLPADN